MDAVSILLGVAGLGVGYAGATSITKKKIGDAAIVAEKKLNDARSESDRIRVNGEKEASEIRVEAQKEAHQIRGEIKAIESRLVEREKNLDVKLEDLDSRTTALRKHEAEVISLKEEVKKIRENQKTKLEEVAKLTQKDAADQLSKMVEKDVSADLMSMIAKKQRDVVLDADAKAQMVILSAMERLASEVTAERTITAIKIDSDDIKGKVIGKEGRNIQALQAATGVDIMMDDTPGYIVLSCFDPIRRQVAREALEMLIKDGRIHPAKIEETVEKAQKNIDKEITLAGEDALIEVGVTGVAPELVHLLGELKFRTSYGQNVLKHSTEMAHLAGMIATDLGADVQVTKTAAILHDIGKALTHKMEGKHHHISGQMLRKYGMSEAIAHAAEAHHDDLEATTPEAMIVRVVDALSAARPGARNVSAENFGARMKDLENIAMGFKGIEKAYAISAGREVRVIVKNREVDDMGALRLAKDISHQIEKNLSYPGTIKVNVIRETRAVEWAK